MHKNFLYSLVILIAITSCATKNDQNQTKEFDENYVEKGQLIENDTLAFLLGTQFEEYVKRNAIDSYSDELVENLHSFDQTTDTIRTFSIKGSKFKKYLYGDGKETLIYAAIEKENEFISDLIRIGVKKEKLSKALAIDFQNDTVTISNQDHTYLFLLYFEKKKLSGITFEAYTD